MENSGKVEHPLDVTMPAERSRDQSLQKYQVFRDNTDPNQKRKKKESIDIDHINVQKAFFIKTTVEIRNQSNQSSKRKREVPVSLADTVKMNEQFNPNMEQIIISTFHDQPKCTAILHANPHIFQRSTPRTASVGRKYVLDLRQEQKNQKIAKQLIKQTHKYPFPLITTPEEVNFGQIPAMKKGPSRTKFQLRNISLKTVSFRITAPQNDFINLSYTPQKLQTGTQTTVWVDLDPKYPVAQLTEMEIPLTVSVLGEESTLTVLVRGIILSGGAD